MKKLQIPSGVAIAATLLCLYAGAAPNDVPPVAVIAGQNSPLVSEPAEKDGLSVVIQVAKKSFKQREPIEVKAVFRNVSQKAFRLPEQVDIPGYIPFPLLLKLEKVGKRELYTGGVTSPGYLPPSHPGNVIVPGGEIRGGQLLKPLGFVEGDLNFDAFRDEVFNLSVRARGTPALQNDTYVPLLQPGTYKLRLYFLFAKPKADSDPTPVWKGDFILSNPVEITIVE